MFYWHSRPRTWARPSRRVARCLAWLCVLVCCLPVISPAQKTDKVEKTGRKLLYRVEPDYPWDLKRAHIGGVVRMDIVISPRGTVDTINVIGGNPILTETATKAVKRWKYAPADAESIVRVNVEFDPNQ